MRNKRAPSIFSSRTEDEDLGLADFVEIFFPDFCDYCEGRKELAHTKVRLQLILFSKIIGAFWFRTFGGFLHVPTTQIYCLTGTIISETHIIIIINNTTRSSTLPYLRTGIPQSRFLIGHPCTILLIGLRSSYLGSCFYP